MRQFAKFTATCLALLSLPTLACGGGTRQTVIDLNYDSVMDRTRPNPGSNLTVHFHIQLVLSGKNSTSQTFQLSSGSQVDSRMSNQTLVNGDSSGVWRVAGRNTLVHIQQMRQSVRTLTVSVRPDNTCSLTVRDVLKPAFSEYLFKASYTDWQYYSRYENINEQCQIR
jgi:hypothetical protein